MPLSRSQTRRDRPVRRRVTPGHRPARIAPLIAASKSVASATMRRRPRALHAARCPRRPVAARRRARATAAACRSWRNGLPSRAKDSRSGTARKPRAMLRRLRPASAQATWPRKAGTRRERPATDGSCGRISAPVRWLPRASRSKDTAASTRGRLVAAASCGSCEPAIGKPRHRYVASAFSTSGDTAALARLAVGSTVAFALPAQVPLDLVARIEPPHLEQAVGEAQRQRRGLRPFERSRLLRSPRLGAPSASPSARPYQAPRDPLLDSPARCDAMPVDAGPAPVQCGIRPAHLSRAPAASIRTAPLAARRSSVLSACRRCRAFREPAAGGHRTAPDAGAAMQIDVVPDRRAHRRSRRGYVPSGRDQRARRGR